jgi:hypothetical protein
MYSTHLVAPVQQLRAATSARSAPVLDHPRLTSRNSARRGEARELSFERLELELDLGQREHAPALGCVVRGEPSVAICTLEPIPESRKCRSGAMKSDGLTAANKLAVARGPARKSAADGFERLDFARTNNSDVESLNRLRVRRVPTSTFELPARAPQPRGISVNAGRHGRS